MTPVPTTLVLVRHGVTDHTTGRRFSGGLGGADPELSEAGREQVRSTGQWLATAADRVDALVASPVRRTRETAELLAPYLRQDVTTEPGLAEMEFGAWDGLTFEEVGEQHAADFEAWLGSPDVVPGGTGESLLAVQERVLAARERLLAEHVGRTVVVVSHVTPIRVLVTRALDAPLPTAHHVELAPASVTVLAHWPAQDERGPWDSVRLVNGLPPDRGAWWEPPGW